MTVLDEVSAAFVQARELAGRHLGPEVGGQVVDMGRVGFGLVVVDGADARAGRSLFGGPARLAPGTRWPEYAGVPLSLLVVLDLAEFVPLLGDELPEGAGGMLLNFFHSSPNIDFGHQGCGGNHEWRVIAAEKEQAVEVAAPDPAVRYNQLRVRAVPMPTLPDGEEPAVANLTHGPTGDNFDYDRWVDVGPFYREWDDRLQERRWPYETHQAFGWPRGIHRSPLQEGREQRMERDPAAAETAVDDWRLLLALQSDGRLRSETGHQRWQWADMGELYFTIPAAALRAGDFTQVEAAEQG